MNNLFIYSHVHINGLIIHSLHVAMKTFTALLSNLLHSYVHIQQHLILPPEANGHRSCNNSPREAPQREDGDNDCPDQSHLVVLQLDVPALHDCLIDKGLNELQDKKRHSSVTTQISH